MPRELKWFGGEVEKRIMNELVKNLLEDYLSGTLTGQKKAEFEAHLKANPSEAEELALYEQSAQLLRDLRPPEEEVLEPNLGFYGRVMQRIESQRRTPFWMVFLEPAFVRRLAFASLMWLALLGGYVVTFDGPVDPAGGQLAGSEHLAEKVLVEPPSPDYRVRMGTDLKRNRDSMLAVLVTKR